MTAYAYRLLNVFTANNDRLSGNPLCVFEDARNLDESTMQALALQFNLSETTFILPSEHATARVRIFTPTFEMPFAGHPTLGTAHVVRALSNTSDHITLEMRAGIIAVSAAVDTWTLQAAPPRYRAVEASRPQLAQMLGLKERDIDDNPLWVNTGSEQLIIPLTSVEAVRRCMPSVELLRQHARLSEARFLAYVWSEGNNGEIEARFFFAKGTACIEDPATGSACANLGGWLLSNHAALPLRKRILQGAACGRPSELSLQVSSDKQIFVSGNVVELGRGVIEL